MLSGTNKFDVTFIDLTWVGTHVIEISGCVGDSATQLFNTNCASTQASIDVVDPCEQANFAQTISISYLQTTLEAEKVGTQYEVPTDTVSSAYGNGYDTCGDREHYLIDSDGRIVHPRPMSSESTNFYPSLQFPFLEFLNFEDGDPNSASTVPVY